MTFTDMFAFIIILMWLVVFPLVPFVYQIIEEIKLDMAWRRGHKEDYPKKHIRIFTRRNREAED